MFRSVRTATNFCHHCGHKLDHAAGITTPLPKAGTVSICCECSGLALFTDVGTLRPPTKKEVKLMRRDGRLMALQRLTLQMIQARNRQQHG